MARTSDATGRNDDFDFGDDDFLGVDDELDQAWADEPVEQQPEPSMNQEEDEAASDENVPGQLAVDVFESKENIFVRARVAGVTKDKLEVTLSDNILTISGALEPTEPDAITGYFSQECYWGKFIRTISLPVPVKEEDKYIMAELKEGVLTVRFTKVKQDIIRKITIQ